MIGFPLSFVRVLRSVVVTTDWSSLLSTKKGTKVVKSFASGQISGNAFYSNFVNTENGGIVRNLFRFHGVTSSRKLAKKALNRRGLV